MSSQTIQPSTLNGIKRLARSIKVERGIQHMRALDEAAQSAGYENFRHADNLLRKAPGQQKHRPVGHPVFLTAYWKDRDDGSSGRETLTIRLSVPWGDIITRPQLKIHRALGWFRAEGADHLVHDNLLTSQSAARRGICAAVRVLQFMDATKLRPSKGYSRAYPDGNPSNAIPGRDHYSVWYQPDTKRYLFVDEPYEGAAQQLVQKREEWARQHGFSILKPEWPGTYAPDIGSRLYLIAHEKNGVSLQPIAAALEKLPTPIVEESWNGESAPMSSHFATPGTTDKAASIKIKSKSPRKLNGKRNSVEYVQTFVGPQRRPKGRMPIEVHVEVGRLLKSVLLISYHRKGVYNRLDAIRSELDEWVQREYSYDELPNEQFFELYYREKGSTYQKSVTIAEAERHVVSLTQVKKLLSEHYPDSPPLRSLFKKLDAAINSLQTWA